MIFLFIGSIARSVTGHEQVGSHGGLQMPLVCCMSDAESKQVDSRTGPVLPRSETGALHCSAPQCVSGCMRLVYISLYISIDRSKDMRHET